MMMRKRLVWLTIAGVLAAIATRSATKRARTLNPAIGRVLSINGVELHYLDVGSGEVLVLLHGNGSLIQDFVISGLVEQAAQQFRVIVFDRPGYGWSTRPRSIRWTPAAQADLFDAALRQLRIGTAHVLGHSWGSLVAVEWALRHPASVRSLVLASGYYYPTARVDALLVSLAALPGLGTLLRHSILPHVARAAWPLMVRQLFRPAHPPPRFSRFPKELALLPGAIRSSAEESMMMLEAAERLQSRYRELELPVAIVAGDADRIVDSRSQSRRLHAEVPGSQLTWLPGVGHMVHHVEPGRVFEATRVGAASTPLAALHARD